MKRSRKTTQALPVKLARSEVLERADRIAWIVHELAEAAAVMKAAKDEHKEVVEALTHSERRYAERIRRRKDPQMSLDLKEPIDVGKVADRLVATMAEIDEWEARLKAAKDTYKEQEKALTIEKVQLAAEIRNREAMQQVEVEWRPDDDKGVVECYRLDTGELVERRLMEEHEAARNFDEVGLAAV